MADRNLVMRIMLNAQDKASAALDRIRQSGSGLAKQLTENRFNSQPPEGGWCLR